MTIPDIDPALAIEIAHQRRRRAALPPLDDLPITEGEALPLDWPAPTIAGPRWYDLPMLASAAVGWAFIVVAALCALAALP